MVQILKGLKTYTLESIPNFQKRSNCRRTHFDWKTSCSLLSTAQMLQFGMKEVKSASALQSLFSSPAAASYRPVVSQHKTHLGGGRVQFYIVAQKRPLLTAASNLCWQWFRTRGLEYRLIHQEERYVCDAFWHKQELNGSPLPKNNMNNRANIMKVIEE